MRETALWHTGQSIVSVLGASSACGRLEAVLAGTALRLGAAFCATLVFLALLIYSLEFIFGYSDKL
jgi:hypothetical protein